MGIYFIIVQLALVIGLSYQVYRNQKQLRYLSGRLSKMCLDNIEHATITCELISKDKDFIKDVELVNKTDYPLLSYSVKYSNDFTVLFYDNGFGRSSMSYTDVISRAKEIRRICKTNCKKGKK